MGADSTWTLAAASVVVENLNKTFQDFPNVPIVPGGSTIGADVPSFHTAKVFDGEWPGSDGIHHAAKDMTLNK